MEWDEFFRQLSLVWDDLQLSLGFPISWLLIPLGILVFLLVTLNVAIILRRRWMRPYVSHPGLLKELAKIRGLSLSQRRILRSIVPGSKEIVQSQLLIDPKQWPENLNSAKQKGLFDKLFPPVTNAKSL